MAIINKNVTSQFQGTIVVPLFKPPYLPLPLTTGFQAGALFAGFTSSTPGLQSSTTVLTAFRTHLLTPLSQTSTIKTGTGSGLTADGRNAIFANRHFPVLNNATSASKPLVISVPPAFFTTNLSLASIPPNITLYNPLAPLTGFPSGLGGLLAADGRANVFYDPAFNALVAGYHWRRSSTGNSVFTVIRSNGQSVTYAPPWPFNQNPGQNFCNVPDPLGVGNCMATTLPGGSGVFICALFRTFEADEIKVTVSWDDAALQAALQGTTTPMQATNFGMLVGSTVDYQDQGATWVLMSPDCTKYYRIRFTNGGGLSEISTAIASNYGMKIDMLGNFFLAPPNSFNVYTSNALALPSLQVPTGGLVPFSLPCWNPCIPPQFLG